MSHIDLESTLWHASPRKNPPFPPPRRSPPCALPFMLLSRDEAARTRARAREAASMKAASRHCEAEASRESVAARNACAPAAVSAPSQPARVDLCVRAWLPHPPARFRRRLELTTVQTKPTHHPRRVAHTGSPLVGEHAIDSALRETACELEAKQSRQKPNERGRQRK